MNVFSEPTKVEYSEGSVCAEASTWKANTVSASMIYAVA